MIPLKRYYVRPIRSQFHHFCLFPLEVMLCSIQNQKKKICSADFLALSLPRDSASIVPRTFSFVGCRGCCYT